MVLVQTYKAVLASGENMPHISPVLPTLNPEKEVSPSEL